MASNGLKSIAYIENLSLEDSELTELCEQAMDWSHTHGFVLRPDEYKDRKADDAKTTVRLCVSTLNDHEFKQSIRPQNLNGNNMGCESRIDLIKDYDFFHKSTSRTTFENLESQLKTEHGIQKIFGAFSTDKNGQAINTNFHFNRSIYKEMALSAILTENHPDILIVLEKNSNEHALEEIRKKKAESV